MMNFENLKHVRKSLPNGGKVVVIDTGALIGPESEAMIQALHSRSVGGVDEHLLKLAKNGAEKFMSMFYVGYGHKSIGDCGSTTIFVEGVSILVAKAIQDSRLYNGQEASTRYIDFAHQTFIDPVGTIQSRAILESWRTVYLEGLSVMKDALRNRHPRAEGEDEAQYTKAINARAFDVMRGFLPAGASTNLAWHTELRQAADHVQVLRHHPLEEVRIVGEVIEQALMDRFPSSFTAKRYEATEEYILETMTEDYYFQGDSEYRTLSVVSLSHNGIQESALRGREQLLSKRPLKTELPKWFADAGTVTFKFLLDFGSFRDIQRHRAVVQRMPLLVPDYGINQWYFDQMPPELRAHIESSVKNQLAAIEVLAIDTLIRQYFLPMGLLVPCLLTGDLPATVYLVELRSGITVHPTLRAVAQQMAARMVEEFGRYGLVLHIDSSEDRFDIKRGLHDIVEK